jgi:hypothetical protein
MQSAASKKCVIAAVAIRSTLSLRTSLQREASGIQGPAQTIAGMREQRNVLHCVPDRRLGATGHRGW